MTTVHRMTLALKFPAGLHAGETRERNALELARDGRGRLVLRGTALAGALRHGYARALGVSRRHEKVERWFGKSCVSEDDAGAPSPLRVADVVLDVGKGGESRRTHVGRSRHTGAALDGSLFSVAATPPGTRGVAVLWLEDGSKDAAEFLASLRSVLGGLQLGGSCARGIGGVEVVRAVHRAFALDSLAEHGAYLDEVRAVRCGKDPWEGKDVPVQTSLAPKLRVEIALVVPRGQDVLVGDGVGLDYEAEPQRTIDHGGNEVWRIPGSTIRGALRAWVTRLAVREGQAVADSARRNRDNPAATGDELAWGFVPPEDRAALIADPSLVTCPVMRLFGSGYARGRLHVSDAVAPRGKEPVRRHVAVDRITGGAQDGLLFDNTVVPAGARFAITLTIESPMAGEARWVAASLRAIDMGLLRIGSSKSSGRLALSAPVRASGPEEAAFASLVAQRRDA